MPPNQSSLPFNYETEYDSMLLANDVTKQIIWAYKLHQQAGTEHLVENLQKRMRYAFEDIVVCYRMVYEWHYDGDRNPMFLDAPYGYRFYHQGRLTRAGAPYLQPEVAVILGYTPNPEKTPAFIEITPVNKLTALLQTASEKLKDNSPLNAWLAAPLAAPADAPEDVYQTLRKVRTDVGVRPTRGRGKMLQYVMREAGVMLGSTGWYLTTAEMERRKQPARS